MIKLEQTQIVGLEPATRGMRNPMNSWDKSDSYVGLYGDEWSYDPGYIIGDNDRELMAKLAKGGPVHAKYRRMIVVYVDITAPLYWWKEFDTYKVGTVANSCSTMHKIHSKEFTIDDFSHEHIGVTIPAEKNDGEEVHQNLWEVTLDKVIDALNNARMQYNNTTDPELKKAYWWQMIQLLPSSYNQKRTIMLNYEVLNNIYHSRSNHKLDEWHAFCEWIKSLPYSWIITGGK